VEIEQSKDAPIESRIPDDLCDHNLSIVHQGILPLINAQPDVGQTEKELIVNQGAALDIFTIQIAVDQIAGQAIANRNQVAAGE